jgi:macrophage erythroblast attacher
MCLFNSVAQVPYENYRKVFRTTQRHVERDLKTVQVTATDLAKQSSSTGVDSEAAVQSIDAMISTVENLKRKVVATSGLPRLLTMHSSPSCTTPLGNPLRMSSASGCSTWLQLRTFRRRVIPSLAGGRIRGWIGGWWTGRYGMERRRRRG